MQQNLTPLEEVLDILEKSAVPLTRSESVPLNKASGRILAQMLTSPFDVPAFDNSRMDGYAVKADECGARAPISQIITAGDAGAPLASGTAARIFTGAPMPLGADSVVMQEDTSSDGEFVTFNEPIIAERFVGRAGEDIAKGQVVLEAGHRLQPQDLGLAASMGHGELEVFARPRVAIFSTGDELKEPGETLAPGQIYNSNRYLLGALLERTGCEVVDYGIVADDLEETRETLRKAASSADMVLTSGGVSVGEKDYLREVLEQTGELNLWRIRIKPGKPLVYGHINRAEGKAAPYMGLPGNPVSVFVTYLMLAQPFLLKLSGASKTKPQSFQVQAGFEQSEPQSRRQFVRAQLSLQDGQLLAVPFDNQSSAVLTSTSQSMGLAVVREGQTIARNDLIEFYPYQGLFG